MILIDGYEIDASLTEEHAFDSEVTEHPVEDGADIADHVRARPITVSIDGIVTNTPIGPIAKRREQLLEINGETFLNPADEAFAKLQAIRDAREPISIETSLRVYKNMVLTSLSAPRDSATGDAFRFRATFVQIQLVTNERTTVRVAVPRAAAKTNLGNKPAAPVAASAVPRSAPAVDKTKAPLRSIPSSTDPTKKTPPGKVIPDFYSIGGGYGRSRF